MTKRDRMKSVYVVKSAPKDFDEKHKELDTKNVYLLKSDAQTIERCRDIVCDFVEEKDGLFLVVGDDRMFFQNFRKAFNKDLSIDQERIRMVPSTRRAMEEIKVYREYQKQPFVFVEGMLDGRFTQPFVEELKSEYPDMFIIVLMNEIGQEQVSRFVEVGTDNFITKPVSVNVLVEKIAYTIEPPDAIGKKIREGKNRLKKVEFALAYGVAREILQLKPGSPAALIIMGDALKGLSKRNDALKMYNKAAENAPMYLEPLKKIVDFHKEDGNLDEALKYLTRIDELSPKNLTRKKELGELNLMQHHLPEATGFFCQAVDLAHEFKMPDCVKMAEDYGAKIYTEDPGIAEPLFAQCEKLARIYKVDLHWSVYNKHGMALRRAKRWQAAVEAYKKASALVPNDESVLFNMGMAYVEGKDFVQAAHHFERAITSSPEFYKENISAAYLMGQVFLKVGSKPLAGKMLTFVRDTDPGFKNIQALLKQLQS